MSSTIKIHFGKGINFSSEYVEIRCPQTTKDNILYVDSAKKIQLLQPGSNQQNLVYTENGLSWEDSEAKNLNLDWRVALDSNQYETLDGAASPADSIENGWKYFGLSLPLKELISYAISENNEWILNRYGNDIHLSIEPNYNSLAEAGGTFYFEWMNANTFNISTYDIVFTDIHILDDEPNSFITNVTYNVDDVRVE